MTAATMEVVATPFVWTDERIETLKRMWAAKATSTQIRVEIGGGVTRSAVVGKLKRLNLLGGRRQKREPKPKAERKRPFVPRPRAEWTPEKNEQFRALKDTELGPTAIAREMGLTRTVTRYRLSQTPSKPAPQASDERPALVSEGVHISDLNSCHCRWIIAGEREDARYCGATRPDLTKPYCPAHALRAYQPGKASDEERRVRAALRARG